MNEVPCNKYVEVYRCKNSEYFLKKRFSFKLSDFNPENFEEQVISEYCIINSIVFTDRDDVCISIDELNLDIYIVINISKANEELQDAKYFDFVLENDNLERAVEEAESIILNFIER